MNCTVTVMILLFKKRAIIKIKGNEIKFVSDYFKHKNSKNFILSRETSFTCILVLHVFYRISEKKITQ